MSHLKIMISAGEVSGDVHASHLVREIKKIKPQARIFGMGGERMKAEGVELSFDITARATVGVTEALGHIFPIISTLYRMKKLLREEKPDVLVLVDFQGFNMQLAKFAKSQGIKTIYYIPPQEWLWGTEKGINNVVNTIDCIIAIFEDEARIYREHGGKVVYQGNPLLDIVKPSADRAEIIKEFNLDPQKPIIGLFPGSRGQEIGRLFPIMLDVVEMLRKEDPARQFVLSIAAGQYGKKINGEIARRGLPIQIAYNRSYDLMSISTIMLAAAGTVSLEAAVMGTPMVVFYKISAVTYFIARHILRIRLPYLFLPNIVANAKVIPELVQADANAARIFSEASLLLNDPSKREEMQKSFELVRKKMGKPGILPIAAKTILEMAGK